MPSSSGISDEIIMHPFAFGDELVDDVVDFVLRPDIDTPRRLVEDQHVGPANSHLDSTTFC
jgi:hypothetical protein